jgi:hypothetical protein
MLFEFDRLESDNKLTIKKLRAGYLKPEYFSDDLIQELLWLLHYIF